MSNTKCSDITQYEVLRPGTVCSKGEGGNNVMNIGMHLSSKHYLTPRLLQRNSQQNWSLLSNNAMIQQTSQIIPESSNSECQRDRDKEFTQVLQRKIKSKTETTRMVSQWAAYTTGRDWANLDERHQSWTEKIPGVFICIDQLPNSKDISYNSV